MAKKGAGSRTGDEETDKILETMEEEGEGVPGFAAADDADEEKDEEGSDDSEEEEEETDDESEDDEEDSEEESSEDDKDESEEEEESDDSESEEEDEEDESADDDEGEEDETGEGDEDDDDESEAHVPIWKRYKNTKKELKDLKKVVADLTKAKSETDFQQKYADFAKKHKLNPDVAKGLVELTAELVKSQVGIDPQTKQQIAELTKRDQQMKFWDRQEKLFDGEFRKNVAPLAARDKRNVADLRKQLRDLAFTPENAQKSLIEIYLALPKRGKKVTSETARGGGRSFKTADLDDLSEVNELPDSEFEKASDALAARSKSKITHHS